MTTLRDVAKRAGVHPSTVSRALDESSSKRVNEATRIRIRQIADELGFKVDAVASGLRRGKTNTVGVVVPDLGNPYVAPTVRGVENSLENRGYMTFIAETQDDSARMQRVFDAMLARRVDAIISLASRRGDESLLRRTSRRVPVILAIRDLPGVALPGVVCDDQHGGRLAADVLLDHGHQQLAQLVGPSLVVSFEKRSYGFRAQAHERGATVVDSRRAATAPTIEEGRDLMTDLLKRRGPRPTAVFAHNDQMALGAIEAMLDAGLSCPGDLSIVGYNDTPLASHTSPPLTTIAMAGYELGRFSAEMALSYIEKPNRDPQMLSLLPRLVMRGSVAWAAGA